jgi:hypothetical protein
MKYKDLKKNFYYFLVALSLSALVSCGGREERRIPIDPSPDSIVLDTTASISTEAGDNKQSAPTPKVVEENKKVSKKIKEEESVEAVSKSISSSQTTYTVSQLNDWLNDIAKGNDTARDEMSKLNSVKVNGAANISDVQQLITDVSNGTLYKVASVQTDANGKVVSITVRK